ncbi:hypothetical protein [Bacillus toyonensis]|uniref:hypothetical protein n=1 Tax=Bacillus toyonensis TaxID=155322 RepID=UPI001C0B1BFD|nr:hypothetical protein [Bacillus toyonensis]MBU4642313.1 hypothetical protein [Bacillus toyonensis]
MKVVESRNHTHKTIRLNEMDIPTLVKYGHSVITFRDEYFIVLDNGNLYDQEKKREIPVYKIFRYIRAVKNSYGVVIAKKSNTRSSLNHVKYAKR